MHYQFRIDNVFDSLEKILGESTLYPYFLFIPAHKAAYLESAKKHGINRLILDLEDSIPRGSLNTALQTIESLALIKKDFYVRVPVLSEKSLIDPNTLDKVISAGVTKFMIPKLDNKMQALALKKILAQYTNSANFEIFLLVESPQSLANLQSILDALEPLVKFTSLGIYDYSASLGSRPESSSTAYAMHSLQLIAKAQSIKTFAPPLLSTTSPTQFRDETKKAFDDGLDGKLIIHPIQYHWLKDLKLLSDEESKQVRAIYREVAQGIQTHGVVKVGDKFYEKPHLQLMNHWIQMEDWNDSE